MSQGKEVVLESEVQVLSRLRHPNIVKLYDVIDAGSILCLVLELVEVSDWHIAWITAQLFSLFLFFQCPIVFLFSLSYFVLFFVFFFLIFFSLNWLKGGDLFDAIAAAGKFSEPEAKRMTQDLASALTYLHSLSIVHRDVKPENLFVRTNCLPSVAITARFNQLL